MFNIFIFSSKVPRIKKTELSSREMEEEDYFFSCK